MSNANNIPPEPQSGDKELTPTQLIKKAILKTVPRYFKDFKCPNDLLTPEDIESAWDYADENDYLGDARAEFRSGEFKTKIQTPYSRHYESRSVAALIDGQWVGWTYWYGGGTHGCPEEVDWMDNAYFLDCKEELVTITQRTFTKK